jgi:hypothetical protein
MYRIGPSVNHRKEHESWEGRMLAIKTEAPPANYKTYFNGRKGTMGKVLDGVDQAFNWNPGKAGT